MLAKEKKRRRVKRTKWIKERKSQFNLLCSLASLFFFFAFAFAFASVMEQNVSHAGSEKRKGGKYNQSVMFQNLSQPIMKKR